MKKLFLMMMLFSSILSHATQKTQVSESSTQLQTRSVRLELRGKSKEVTKEKEKRRKISPENSDKERLREELYDDWVLDCLTNPF